MTLIDFTPQNDLELVIVEAKQGRKSIECLLLEMASADLYISSKSEVLEDGTGFEPLLLEAQGNPLVAAFSSLERPGLHSAVAKFVLQMNGREFFLRLPPKYGVIINPGYVTQLIVPPTAVVDLKTELKVK